MNCPVAVRVISAPNSRCYVGDVSVYMLIHYFHQLPFFIVGKGKPVLWIGGINLLPFYDALNKSKDLR